MVNFFSFNLHENLDRGGEKTGQNGRGGIKEHVDAWDAFSVGCLGELMGMRENRRERTGRQDRKEQTWPEKGEGFSTHPESNIRPNCGL